MVTENPPIPDRLIDQLRYLADTPSYTAFHSEEERQSVCEECSGEFCNEKWKDASRCIYSALSKAADTLVKNQAKIEQLRSELELYKKSGLEPCDYAAMVSLQEQLKQCRDDLSTLMGHHQYALDVLKKDAHIKEERDAAIQDLHGKCSVCSHYTPNHNEGPCRNCSFEIARDHTVKAEDNWEWRGLQLPRPTALSNEGPFPFTAEELEAAHQYQEHRILLRKAEQHLRTFIFGDARNQPDSPLDEQHLDALRHTNSEAADAIRYFEQQYSTSCEEASSLLDKYVQRYQEDYDPKIPENTQWVSAIHGVLIEHADL